MEGEGSGDGGWEGKRGMEGEGSRDGGDGKGREGWRERESAGEGGLERKGGNRENVIVQSVICYVCTVEYVLYTHGRLRNPPKKGVGL